MGIQRVFCVVTASDSKHDEMHCPKKSEWSYLRPMVVIQAQFGPMTFREGYFVSYKVVNFIRNWHQITAYGHLLPSPLSRMPPYIQQALRDLK